MTEEDIEMVKYFWQDKGDLERWVDWKNKLPEIERTTPHLVKAWRDYVASVKILRLVVDSL